MAQVYISYQSDDQKFALEVSDGLEKLGHSVAIDKKTLKAGGEWRKAMSDALFRSDAVVFLLSSKALESKFVMTEIGEARGLHRSKSIQLLPVILDDAEIPPVISDIQAIFAPDRNAGQLVFEIDRAINSMQPVGAKGGE